MHGIYVGLTLSSGADNETGNGLLSKAGGCGQAIGDPEPVAHSGRTQRDLLGRKHFVAR